jgi:hypothetical protein
MRTPRRPGPQQEALEPVLARTLVQAGEQELELHLPPRFRPDTALGGVYESAHELLCQAFSAELGSCISAAVFSNAGSWFVNQQFDACRLACITAGGSVVAAATYRVIASSTQGRSLMVRRAACAARCAAEPCL